MTTGDEKLEIFFYAKIKTLILGSELFSIYILPWTEGPFDPAFRFERTGTFLVTEKCCSNKKGGLARALDVALVPFCQRLVETKAQAAPRSASSRSNRPVGLSGVKAVVLPGLPRKQLLLPSSVSVVMS